MGDQANSIQDQDEATGIFGPRSHRASLSDRRLSAGDHGDLNLDREIAAYGAAPVARPAYGQHEISAQLPRCYEPRQKYDGLVHHNADRQAA